MKLISTVKKAHNMAIYTYTHKVGDVERRISATAMNETIALKKVWKQVSGMYKQGTDQKLKVAVIIPDRGDRKAFMTQCVNMLDLQTVKFDEYVHVDDKPINSKVDITWRYRKGYDSLRGRGFDLIFFMENDDYYNPKYVETMIAEWEKAGRPDLFGSCLTVYYHLHLKAYFTMRGDQRAPSMQTLIRPDLDFQWPLDDDPYTDAWLWKNIENRKIFEPKEILAIGIKHGVGMCGGENHTTKLHRFINKDKKMEWLKQHTDDMMFKFYSEYKTPAVKKEPDKKGKVRKLITILLIAVTLASCSPTKELTPAQAALKKESRKNLTKKEVFWCTIYGVVILVCIEHWDEIETYFQTKLNLK